MNFIVPHLKFPHPSLISSHFPLIDSYDMDTHYLQKLDSHVAFKRMYPYATKTNLGAILSQLGIQHAGRLHNAANDAHVTLLAILTAMVIV